MNYHPKHSSFHSNVATEHSNAISNAGFEVTVITGPTSYLSTQVC